MRVLQAITSGELGGAQVHLAALVRALVDAGIDVEVACGPGEFVPSTLSDIASVQRVPWLRSAPSPVDDARSLGALVRLARGRDVVHTHSAKAGVLGRVAARIAGVRAVVHTSHGSFLAENLSPPRRAVLLAAERVAAAMTTHLLYLSEADLGLMRSHGLYRSTPATLVRIVTPRLAHPSGSWAHRRGAPIVAVANHYPNKGLDVLLRAFASVTSSLPETELVLVGDGPERQALERLARELDLTRVRFLGRVADPTTLVRDAAVFVLPSRKEGLPLALLEALALGVPAVSTRVGAVSEVVSSDEVEIVPPEDPEALGVALVSVVRDEERARRLSTRGRLAAARFVSEASIDPVLAAYRSGDPASVDSSR